MRRTLSARSTAFYHALPWLWLAAAGAAAWMMRGEREMLPALVGTAVVPAVALYLLMRQVRRVSTDGRVLFVAARGREVVVPFSEIAEVREHRGGRRGAPRVTLRLKTPCELGEEIHFVPRMRWWPDTEAAGRAQALQATDPDAAAMAMWASFSPAEEIRQRMQASENVRSPHSQGAP